MAVKTRSNRPVANGDWSGTSPGSSASRSTAGSTTRGGGRAVASKGPAGLALIGFLALLAGAWGGIVPYLGPAFGYTLVTGTPSFTWTLEHTLLYFIPGVVAIVAAFSLLGLSRSRSLSGLFGAGTAGLLLVACGAWFVLGVIAWPILYSTPSLSAGVGPTSLFINLLGYNLGIGAVLVLLGGMALGVARAGRRL